MSPKKGPTPRRVEDQQKVVIGYCSDGDVSALFTQSLVALQLFDGNRPARERHIQTPGAGVLGLQSGPRIAAARNTIVRQFLTNPVLDAEWLWMLDSDMVFEPDVLDSLLDAADPVKRPIMGGLCIGGGRTKMVPTLYRISTPEEWEADPEHDKQPVRAVEDWPDGKVVKVDATGAACLLMHREALIKIGNHYGDPVPWFAESVYKGVKEIGEDITFCFRAQSVGIPIYVHTGAQLGHVKPFVMDLAMWRAWKTTQEVKWQSPTP